MPQSWLHFDQMSLGLAAAVLFYLQPLNAQFAVSNRCKEHVWIC